MTVLRRIKYLGQLWNSQISGTSDFNCLEKVLRGSYERKLFSFPPKQKAVSV